MGAGTGIFNGAGMGILLRGNLGKVHCDCMGILLGGNPIVIFNSAGLGIL